MLLSILALLALLLIAFTIYFYNKFIQLQNKTAEAWSDIDVQLKRRYDLIPNLVSTVQGYASHEKTVFDNVVKARSLAMGASAPEAKGHAENQLGLALKSLFAIAEAYPELKANQNFLALQEQLAQMEETIQAARRYYNGNVRELNTSVQMFPSNLVANSFGFSAKAFFELEEAAAKEPVAVKF